LIPHEAYGGRWAIFDLDGTLVDSRPHVLWSIDETARLLGIKQVVKVRIGPALKDLLRAAFCMDDEQQLVEAMQIFMKVHDGNVGPGCTPYQDALILWNTLQESGVRMAVATNKREGPARSILTHWKFGKELPLLACADSVWLGGQASKTQMGAALLADFGAPKSRTMMIGDSHEDMLAAQASGLGLALFAAWGYGLWQGVGQAVADPLEALRAATMFYAQAAFVPNSKGYSVSG
jgi:phosphoglycolate phosphatase